MADAAAPESLLPLQPATFHILMSLADEDRHGYAIIQDVAARTGGEVRLSAGTLYRSIQRMLDAGPDRRDRTSARPLKMTTSGGAITASRSSAQPWPAPKRGGWPAGAAGAGQRLRAAEGMMRALPAAAAPLSARRSARSTAPRCARCSRGD